MTFIINDRTDPYFNLASESFLLTECEGDFFMLWRNAPSVIIGKNQNTWAEVNVPFVEKNGIVVARRLTGGGAVFHDLGNVNFSFITDASEEDKLKFGKFLAPVIKALADLGVRAELDGRNDIVADGYKISGNAQCVVRSKSGKERLLHHGTLLFGADMGKLSGALKVSEEKMRSKGIKSVKSRVKNITELESYSGPDTVEEFMSALASSIAGDTTPSRFKADEISRIEEIRKEKFATRDWNFGASPEFENEREKRFPFGTLRVYFTCREGKIADIVFYGDHFGVTDPDVISRKLTGAVFDRAHVISLLDEKTVNDVFSGAFPEDIADLIFPE